MQVYSKFFFSLFAIIILFWGKAQRFSGDKKEFSVQVISRLQAIGTEPAKKIAFDFGNAWNGKFTSDQQDKVYQIALGMQKKGYQFYPYFYHYFTYLAYSATQENLQTDNLSKVLAVNEQVVETLSKSEYKEFLFGLNIFFARRYLSLDKNMAVQVPDGSYHFDLLGDNVGIQEEITAQKESALTSDDPWDNSNDLWVSDSWVDQEDTWEDNAWSSSEDSWGNEFGDTDDSWGNDDGWKGFSESVEEPKPSRPMYSPITIDYVAQKQSQYMAPKKSGPVIELSNARLVISTPYDSLKIKNLKGSFLLKNRSLVGTQGSIKWPAASNNFRGAIVQLEDFFIRKDRADFWTPHATLQFDEKMTGKVEGAFEYNSMPRPKRTLNKYPIFTSHSADVKVKLNDNKITYTGGIQLRGNRLFGKSVSQELGTLKILDGRGNTIILKSKEFVLGDSLMSMNNGSITIYHGSDSIYHESVQAKFDVMTRGLRVLRNITTKPYRSSYFDVSLGVDLITWNMEVDSIAMEIMNGKDLLPATFESFNFFDDFRYRKVARSLNFHPINLAVHYALKYDLEEFYVGELAIEYEINENFAKAAGKVLSQHGFADYNVEPGLLKLYPEAFHYYNSSARKVDFDNLMIPSKIKNGSNAYIQLDSGKLHIRGVSRFYITTDFKVYGLPHDGKVTLLKGRDIEFDGDVRAGDFDYQGNGHQFIYDEFLFNMPRIDSMKITVTFHDTTEVNKDFFEKIELDNELTNTSGTLIVNDAQNKSNLVKNERYPYFKADSKAVVYFNGIEILDGAYDKSVRFVIPPFELDSIERRNGESISFEGTFISGGIFPSFSETLHVQEDKSLGFKHQIPERGYSLYGTEAKTYEEIRISNKGIRGYGQIDFLSTKIYSDDFIYYPDSVTTNGTSGIISPGTYKSASYPEAVFGAYDMYWLPRKDSMYLHTVGEPFKFYEATAELDGFVNITTNGVYGGGTMLTRGSEAISNELNFKEFEYGAKHASFHILTHDAKKPAMAGDDIRLDFDLTTNTAVIRPEKSGVAAISFPYAQMKTSITEAVWDLEDSVVTMTKPPNIPIQNSYFFSTREELDSLVFNAERAIYDINSEELNIQGIPYIIVADSKIIPENNETTIFANSELQEFTNAEIIIDTLNGYHYLDRANIKILSRNKFEGNAYYKQIVDKDTFDIRFDSFELQEAPIKTPNKKGVITRLMTVSGGEVPESTNLRISPGFIYKGSVTMYAHKPALELDGFIQLDFKDREYNMWVQFQRTEEERDVQLTIDDAEFETGQEINVGIHENEIDELYVTFVELKKESMDADLFTASGVLSFDDSSKTYLVETPSKTNGSSYAGSTMAYNEHTGNILFEGPVDFIDQSNSQIFMKASVIGSGNRESMELTADAMMALDIPSAPVSAIDEMAIDLMEIIERMGAPIANEISMEFLYKLANISTDRITKEFENASLKGYIPLGDMITEIGKTLFVSGVKMNWNQKHKAWHNTTKIGVSNINRADINAQLDGFLEIKKDNTGEDIVNIFLQAAPGVWYYMGFSANQLIMFSSNPKFNEMVQFKSNVDKSKPSELVLALGDENETLSFINNFRLNYFGIEEPYNLIHPDEMNTEDETFDTIEEEDDGFGFN